MANSAASAAANQQQGYILNQTLFDLDPPAVDRPGESDQEPGGTYVTLGPGKCAELAIRKAAPGKKGENSNETENNAIQFS